LSPKIKGEPPVTFRCPLPVPALDFKKLRLVAARARKFESRAATGGKIWVFCRKKGEIQFFIEKIYRFWVFSFHIIYS
jgi:hypothetical protein